MKLSILINKKSQNYFTFFNIIFVSFPRISLFILLKCLNIININITNITGTSLSPSKIINKNVKMQETKAAREEYLVMIATIIQVSRNNKAKLIL